MSSLLVQDQILVQALKALSQKRNGSAPNVSLPPTSASGAVPLYPDGFFPWKSLPYPQEHARLGGCLAELGELGAAERLARFQRALCDHAGKPIPSLFCQEGKVRWEELEENTARFFDLVGMPKLTPPFIDEELGLVREGNEGVSALITASGCMTGLGAFLSRSAGVLTYGPQLSTVGNCSGFGIAGRPSDWSLNQNEMCARYKNRLATPLRRETGIDFLQDAGFSGLWVDVEQKIGETFLQTRASIFGPGDQSPLNWTLFGKANTCIVAGSHRLSANSLDRYHGPIQSCVMEMPDGAVVITSQSEGMMEVIPLAGDNSFWGANFLIAYSPVQSSTMDWHFKVAS